MLTINWKQIYEIHNKWILILYDISKNHYVGLPVYNEEQENSIFIKSINKYVVLDEITDYNRTNIKRCIYTLGSSFSKGRALLFLLLLYDNCAITIIVLCF